MLEKAVTSMTIDYQLVFLGYTFAIKKLTRFAQVGRDWAAFIDIESPLLARL